MLRGFFESHGYYDLLSPPSNSIQTISELGSNLPVGVSAALDIIFLLLFPNGPLVGQNHRARPDALMCRKIVRLIREFDKTTKRTKAGRM